MTTNKKTKRPVTRRQVPPVVSASPADNLRETYETIQRLKALAVQFTQIAFPIGETFSYTHGYSRRFVTVVEHSEMFDRVKVVGATDRQYWVEASQLLRS